jgi:hypothetical protein
MTVLAGAFLGAVALGHKARPAPARVRGCVPPLVVPGYLVEAARMVRPIDLERNRTAFLLDPDTGAVVPWRVGRFDFLLDGAFSPWTDAVGRRQVATSWWDFSVEGVCTGSGIARISYPDGAMLDRIEVDRFPMGPPCWAPGTAPAIVYGALDGQLYRFAFEGSRAPGASFAGRDAKPEPLAWRAGGEGSRPYYLGDPSWPADPRLAGNLLAAGTVMTPEGLAVPALNRRLWALRLDPDGASIVAAGPLLDDRAADTERLDRRYPVVAAQPDGSLVLGSLATRPEETLYELRIAPLRFDPRTGTPHAWVAGERVLAKGCLGVPPAFSDDGCWVCCLPKPSGTGPRALRLPVGLAATESAFDADPPAPSVRATTPAAVNAK